MLILTIYKFCITLKYLCSFLMFIIHILKMWHCVIDVSLMQDFWIKMRKMAYKIIVSVFQKLFTHMSVLFASHCCISSCLYKKKKKACDSSFWFSDPWFILFLSLFCKSFLELYLDASYLCFYGFCFNPCTFYLISYPI